MNNVNSKGLWEHHVIGVLNTNCYVFGDPKNAIMIDPGGDEAITIAKDLMKKEIEIKHVLVTHGHFDHLGWAWEVQKICEGANVYLHEGEKESYEPFLDRLKNIEIRQPDIWLKNSEILKLGKYEIEVLHTPGHSPGSVVYKLISMPNEIDLDYIPLTSNNSAFVGDCIFEGSIGRVDLPFSNPENMAESLKYLIKELNSETVIYPGHGNITNMNRELLNNPYLLALQRGIQFF